ncbi:MAG TPA: acyl-CoA synthetase [Candidatus Limnocylindrales bacterium]|nr:acyl-CoA synthetase [Candidatus Limnocylindrales bacterium]
MGVVTDKLWPRLSAPSDLDAVERVPLDERGLPESTYGLVARAAQLWPDRPAVSVLPDADRFLAPRVSTFAELAEDVHRAAAVLAGLGVQRGDAVAVISVNCGELLPVLLAAQAVGIYAPINPGLAPEHAIELVRLSGAAVVVASGPELDPDLWVHAQAIAAATGARALLALRPTVAPEVPAALEPLEGVEVAYLSERMAESDGTKLAGPPPAPDDIASYLHTGGTTGTPKLAVRTHANEVSNAWMISARDVLDQNSVLFAALPLFHTNALLVTVLAPLLKGQHVVWGGPLGYRDVPLFQNFWKIVEHYRIAALSGVPTVYAVLAQMPVDADISSLRLPIVGAAPLPAAVATAFEARTGVALCEGYGLTEGTCASAFGWPDAPRHDTVGQRLPYQEARAVAVDEATGEWTFLPDNEVGTLVLRGPNVFAGYLVGGDSGPQVRADGKVRDGWLDTGDLAAVDADGFIRLAGRAKDLIIRGGHNIDPATIEDALLEHPGVTDAAAVGRPDPHSGEVPVAFVTIRADSGLTADELVGWATERVPERAAAPKAIEIVDEIPLTSVGKQYKPELRRRAAEQAARAALAETGLSDTVKAILIDGQIEIRVPQSRQDDEVQAMLSQYAWRWKLTNEGEQR